MLVETRLSIRDLFFPKLIALENYEPAAPTIISEAKNSCFPWYSSTPSTNPLFSWHSSSSFTDYQIHKFRYILQHGPYNFSSHSYYNKHGFNLCIKNKVFARDSFSLSKNHYHKLILTKLASFKNSVLGLFDSEEPENYPTTNILSDRNKNYLVSSPSAAIGISSILKRNLLLSLGAVRHYHNNRRLHFAPQVYSRSTRFIRHVKKQKILYMVGLGLVTIFLIGWETVPYSKRKHFIIIPASKDKSFETIPFERGEENFVLPRDHPDSVRVSSILNQILQALQSDLKIKQMSGLEYISKNITSNVDEEEVTVPWWRRTKFSTRHLEGLNWEVVVVDKFIKNAFVLPAGKIVVYKGLLKLCKSDAQIATVIGHEVGHVVARHHAETFTKWLCIRIGLVIILLLVPADIPNLEAVEKLEERILNPYSRRDEKEADYIGLLVMASAGYDPRVAPHVYRMLDYNFGKPLDSKYSVENDFGHIHSTHPSGRKRAEELSKPEVMEEAMARYSKVIETRRRNQLKDDKGNTVKDSLTSFFRRIL